MAKRMVVSWAAVYARATKVVEQIILGPFSGTLLPYIPTIYIYPIPRGGIFAAQAVRHMGATHHKEISLQITEDPKRADIYIDDLVDTGKTREHIQKKYGPKPLYALYYKQQEHIKDWIEFPWERMIHESGPEENIRRILEYIGENPNRDGLVETPARVVRSYDQLFGGYKQDPKELFKTFYSTSDEMIILRGAEFWSTCVVGSTFVETPKGRIPIQYLKAGDFVYSYNENKGKFEVEKCYNPRITKKNAQLVRVYSDKDTVLCTPSHKFLVNDKGWVKAKDLVSGDSIVALNKGATKTRGGMRPTIKDPNDVTISLPEHRIIYESLFGKISSKDHIHHIDENPANNDPSNLTLMNPSAHSRLHSFIDQRGQREATRWKNMTDEERFKWEEKRKEALKALHNDPVRLKEMTEKRRKSVKAHWDKIKLDKKAYATRIKNMGQQKSNHRILGIEKVKWREDVWCMSVPINHNFVSNGMVVHNCEHHLLPFFGHAHIAYIPKDGKVIGISKLARILECYSRRVQIQERLTQQITSALDEYLKPLGSACIIKAKHLCMVSRGVQKQQSDMITSSLTGVFRTDSSVKQELFQMIKG